MIRFFNIAKRTEKIKLRNGDIPGYVIFTDRLMDIIDLGMSPAVIHEDDTIKYVNGEYYIIYIPRLYPQLRKRLSIKRIKTCLADGRLFYFIGNNLTERKCYIYSLDLALFVFRGSLVDKVKSVLSEIGIQYDTLS